MWGSRVVQDRNILWCDTLSPEFNNIHNHHISFEENIFASSLCFRYTDVAWSLQARWPPASKCSDKIWMWHFILFSVLKLKMPFKKPDFTIDDAFSESAEDKIRLYTRTSESVPLTEETIQVQFNQSRPYITIRHTCRRSLLGFPTLQVPRVIQKQFLWAALPAQRQTLLL